MHPQVIDLFCGCGGLSLGLEMSGFRIALGADSNSVALNTFKRSHPGAIALECDLQTMSGAGLLEAAGIQDLDLLVGGPPCQGVSLSGLRKLDDPRNKLLNSYIGLVEQIMPRAFIMENVPGLVTLFRGALMQTLTQRLASFGYKLVTCPQ